MKDQWTRRDSAAAISQGWDVFDVGPIEPTIGATIQRHDEGERFDDDTQAIIYVEGRADAGDERARKAMRICGYTQRKGGKR